MRFGYPSEPPTLDPLAPGGGSAATRDVLRPVLPALFRLDARLRPEPELAAAWPEPADIALDPFTVTVRLRTAKWSDGTPITSEDVSFSWTKLRAGPTRHRYRYLRDVETPSATAVRLLFDRPVRRWWSLFSVDDMVLPAHAYSARWKNGPTVSGGPFAFDGWTRGLRIRLVRNRAYDGVVPLAGIDVLFVPDHETRLQLLDRGDLDAFFSEGESNVGRRATAYDLRAQGVWGPTWWEIDLDPGRTGLATARAVVEAASPDLVAEILEDSGRSMNGIPPAFGSGGRPTAEPWRGRGSLDVAKEVLGSGKRQFQLGYGRAAAAGALAAFLHHRLRKIGVTAELVGVEPDTFEESFVVERRTPAMVRLRRGADAPDASAYSATFGQPGSAAIDDGVVAAETTVDAQRLRSGPVVGLDAAGWAAAQRDLVGASTAAPLARVRTWIVSHDGVNGVEPTGAAHGPLWNTAAWTLAA